MPGEAKHRLFEVCSDRDGGLTIETLTLGALARRVESAVHDGVPLDAKIKHGFLPNQLADCLYVEKPIDITKVGFDQLRDRASSVVPDVSNAAWAEIRRRVEALGLPGDHDD